MAGVVEAMATITADLVEGFRVEINNGRHHWTADEPVDLGGTDEGPNPYELLLGALAACTNITVAMYARRKEWSLDSISVRYEFDRVHADDCESYWYNLLGEAPALFVVCFLEDEEAGPVPVLVTASQDEANAHLESDDPVFSVPMPDQVHQWVERFVVENYRPVQKKKRRRRDWAEEAAGESRAGRGR